MKRLFAGLLVAGLIAFTGCGKDSGPGGPGASPKDTPKSGTPRAGGADTPRAGGTDTPRKTEAVDKDNTFEVKPPRLETNLTQGETKTVTFSISRGKTFSQPVTIKFEDNKKGLKFDPASPKIEPSDKEDIQVKITAEDKADLDKHEITVTSTGTSGQPHKTTFTVDVKAKK